MELAKQKITNPCTEAWTQAADGPRGGDFIIRHETSEDITMILCDAAGHGEAAVEIAEFTRPIIQREIAYGLSDTLIRRWHGLVHNRFAEDPRFVCFTALRLHFATRLLTVVNAGNPDLLIRRECGHRIERFASNGMPLGIVGPEEWTAPKLVQTFLGGADFAIAFSDGVTDRLGSDGRRFGMERVLDTIRWTSGAMSPLGQLRQGLMRFSSTTQEQDDLSVFVLRSRPRLVA
jgi:serine phosphatase RsbU (regulator of sigma subunit)